MLIGIDGNEANVIERVGVNVYAFGLLWGLYETRNEWGKTDHVIVFLKNEPRADLPPESDCFKYKILKGGKLWVLTRLMPHLIINKSKLDVFFAPTHYLPPIAAMPMVCAIMDLGYLMFSGQFKKKDYWQLRLWSAISITVSKSVIAISNATKQDIVRHYPFAEKKIEVTYPAYDRNTFNGKIDLSEIKKIKNQYHIVNDYLLFISTLKPSKNVDGLIRAYKLISEKTDKVPSLVITGKKGWMYEKIYEEVKRLNLSEKIIFTGFVPENEKKALISGAKALILPSFWEGFGIDVLESLASGIPVVVSKAASLPEVAGKAGIYIDPNDISSIASGIDRVLSMGKMEYNKLAGLGKKQAGKFTWEDSASQTLKILRNTAK